jgi:hypothetical protein
MYISTARTVWIEEIRFRSEDVFNGRRNGGIHPWL